MKLIPLSDVPKSLVHDSLMRQRFIGPGDLKSAVQTVNYVELVKGETFEPRIHPDCEECFFIIDGEADAEIASQRITLHKGDFLVIEPGEKHFFINNNEAVFIYFQFRVLV